LGKKPIVVNDCPGFFVNRVLFPYLNAFEQLLHDGADYLQVDQAMENFGWPMGPAYLLDVVGLDIASHAATVLAKGFPDRMKLDFKTASGLLHDQGSLGQKSASGFYKYETDRRGKPKKIINEEAIKIINSIAVSSRSFEDQEIIERMMIPLCLETVRCVEDHIVDSPATADMGLIWGIGFPPFRGGPLRYIDSIGAEQFCTMADNYSDLGAAYDPPELLTTLASANAGFFSPSAGDK
ncbi:MAG: fatty acid oxidation complex subunit alpha FadB, partial [Thiothrix sp.]